VTKPHHNSRGTDGKGGRDGNDTPKVLWKKTKGSRKVKWKERDKLRERGRGVVWRKEKN